MKRPENTNPRFSKRLIYGNERIRNGDWWLKDKLMEYGG